MAAPTVHRIYEDAETMLRVYNRRLQIANAQFDKGEPERRHFIERYRMRKNIDQEDTRGHIVNVTDGTSNIDTMFASMTAVEIEYICRVIGNGTVEGAIAATNALNQAWRDTRGRKRMKRAVKDALLVDYGVAKVYYEYQEDEDLADKPQEAVDAEIEELLGRGMDREAAAEAVTLTETVQVVLRDRVCVDYVPWNMIRVDPTAKQPEDVRWVCQYTLLPVFEVTENPAWKAFVLDRYGEAEGQRRLDDLEGDTTALTAMEGDYKDISGIAPDADADDPRITVAEMWDFESGLVTVFPKGHDDLVLFQRLNPLNFCPDLEDRNPYKFLVTRDDPDSLWGVGDMRVFYPSLKELDEYRTDVAEHVHRSIPKLFGPDRALGQKGKEALESQEWMAFVPLEESHTYSEFGSPEIKPVPAEVYRLIDKIKADMRESVGANEVSEGVFPQKRISAAEANYAVSGGERRQAERRSAFEEWLVDIARTMLRLMQLSYDRARMLEYTNDLGETFQWTWNKQSIAFEADIDVAITPLENLTREERFNRALRIANLLLPMPFTDQPGLMQWVMRETGLSEGEIRILIKTPQEVAAEQAAAQAGQAAFSVQPQSGGGGPPGLGIQLPRSA